MYSWFASMSPVQKLLVQGSFPEAKRVLKYRIIEIATPL